MHNICPPCGILVSFIMGSNFVFPIITFQILSSWSPSRAQKSACVGALALSLPNQRSPPPSTDSPCRMSHRRAFGDENNKTALTHMSSRVKRRAEWANYRWSAETSSPRSGITTRARRERSAARRGKTLSGVWFPLPDLFAGCSAGLGL